jgi:segregation and condensation protein A
LIETTVPIVEFIPPFKMDNDKYIITLPDFEGPLDLLLFFIKRDELNIYDIPISKITEEFLVYTQELKILDLERSGEFIVMASMLMQIKAKMLIPKEERLPDEPEEDDPRAELIRRLLEYKQYKEVSEELKELEDKNRFIFYRELFTADIAIHDEVTPDQLLKNVTLFDLLKTFKRALDKAPKVETQHKVEQINYNVEEQAEYILSVLGAQSQTTFFTLVGGLERIGIIVTFLALLELIKNSLIGCEQSEDFDDMLIFKL